MSDDTPSPLNNVITIDDERIKSHLERVVRGTVEETLNALLDAEADRLYNAQRYERSEARRDSCAGHYERGAAVHASLRIFQRCERQGRRPARHLFRAESRCAELKPTKDLVCLKRVSWSSPRAAGF